MFFFFFFPTSAKENGSTQIEREETKVGRQNLFRKGPKSFKFVQKTYIQVILFKPLVAETQLGTASVAVRREKKKPRRKLLRKGAELTSPEEFLCLLVQSKSED